MSAARISLAIAFAVLWASFCDREVYRHMSGDRGPCLTLAGVRAAMQHAGDPGSLLGAF
jgi:hypothetical protein